MKILAKSPVYDDSVFEEYQPILDVLEGDNR